MLLILAVAGWILLLITLCILLRDFMPFILRKSLNFTKTRGFVDFGEHATTWFIVGLISVCGFLLYKFLMAMLAYMVSDELISFFRIMRAVYSVGSDIQNPFIAEHLLTGLFGKTFIQLLSCFFIYRAIRLFMFRMNAKFRTATYSEGDVIYYGFFATLIFIALEILFYIQNIPQLSRTIHLFYLVIANTSIICYFLALSHIQLMARSRYRRSLPRYLEFSSLTKNIIRSPVATLSATWLTGIILNAPQFLGTQFLENNVAVVMFGLLSLTLFYLVARKVLARGFNYFGAIMFFDSDEPVNHLWEHRYKHFLPPFKWLAGGIGLILLLGAPKSFGVLLILTLPLVTLILLLHVIVHMCGLGLSVLISDFKGHQKPEISWKAMTGYLKVTSTESVLGMAPGLLLIVITFSLLSLYPKSFQVNAETNYVNTVVDSNGESLFIETFDGNACVPISKEDIPPSLTRFVQLQEDRDFARQHRLLPTWSNWHGISLASVYRMITGAGGGSNINMQLIKNAAFSGTFPRDFQRKYTEMLTAYQLSLQLKPEEIITHYVNYAGMNGGAGHQGLVMAARNAFGRSTSDLNELEQLYLVSTLKRGTMFKTSDRYVSYREVPYHQEEVKETILQQARAWNEQGLLSDDEMSQLREQRLRFINSKPDPGVALSTREFLKSKIPGSNHSGHTYFTTLTLKNQQLMTNAVGMFEHYFRDNLEKEGYRLYSAAIVVDIKSGHVIGHHGGPGISDLTTLAGGSPVGSLIKPFILLELLEEEENTSTLKLFDGKVKGRYTPNNYSRRYSNQMKGINEIISKSLNAPMVNVRLKTDPIELFSKVENRLKLLDVSPDPFLDLANVEKAGEYEVNYPLGSRNMTLFDIAQAYQTLLNDGIYKELSVFNSVYDPANMKREQIPQKSRQVYQKAAILKNAMHHTMLQGGTGTHMLHLLPGTRQFYAKTGTSDKAIHGYTVLSDGRILIVSYVTYGKVIDNHLELNATPPIPHGSGVRSAGILAAMIYNGFNKPSDLQAKLASN